MSITRPNDMAEAVKAKARDGECASESEGIRDGLRALESWLRNQVGPAYDALKADPARAVPANRIRARLAAEQAKTR